MKLRSQLILAFLVLAVLPLGGIVAYSYVSSTSAFRSAVEAETLEVTRQISIGLQRTRQDLQRYVAAFGFLPFDDVENVDSGALVDQLLSRLGEDGAEFLDALAFVPRPPPRGANDTSAVNDLPPEHDDAGRRVFWVRQGPGAESGSAGGSDGDRAPSSREWFERARSRANRLFGGPVWTEVHRDGKVVGELHAAIRPGLLMRTVLRRTPRGGGAVPFALAGEGEVYTSEPAELDVLREVRCADGQPLLEALVAQGEAACQGMSDWVVVTRDAEETELVYGIARPIGTSLAEMRNASLRNFGVGVGLLSLSFLAVVPLSTRLTRRLSHLTRQVERLARGDAAARSRCGGRDEVGKLGEAFNRMARDQEKNRQALLDQERYRRQQEVDRRLLEAENERQTQELEEARRFQLSLLPRELPEHPDLEIAVFQRTASEVGGDYYDFSGPRGDGSLTIAVGDATGHGARAGTMVTVVKTLIASADMDLGLAGFLADATATIRSMELGRRAMALVLVRYQDGALDLASAGMPPMLVSRAPSGEVEEMMSSGVPLGTLARATYEQHRVTLGPGDAALLLSDGLPEMLDTDGAPVGYEAVTERWRQVGQRSAEEAVAEFERWVEDLSPQGAPADDVTFVVVKRRAEPTGVVANRLE